jgi:PIN domain nuclease of toxin-antitoxin system
MVMPYVTDTHALIWHMTDDAELSVKAKEIFNKVDSAQEHIFIPCIIFLELLYLVEKNRIPVDFDSVITMISSSKNYRVEPLCLPIIEKSRTIPMEKVTDPWDRLIAATSMHLSLPLITRDKTLRKKELGKKIGLETIW